MGYFFAVKTVDDTFNWSDLSNIDSVTRTSAPSPDGPTAVTDLDVSYQSGDLSLTFTSPAASPGSEAPVSQFVVRYSHNREYVTENNFHNHDGNDDVEFDDLLSGSLTTPPAPGTLVTLRLKPYEIFDDDEGHSELFFSMMSVDALNRWSKLSNIDSVLRTSAPSPDGPTAVTDLDASYQSGDLSLTFTSPAASPGSETPVSRFVVRYSHNREYVTENNFHNHEGNDDVEFDDLLSGSLTTPPAPGTLVTLRLKPYEIFDDDEGHSELFFSMMSVDALNRWSKLSNIDSVLRTSAPSPDG